MTNIVAVANKTLEISDFSLTNLKLQKILYYVYGTNLVINTEQISECPQAWDYWPVFPTVYNQFRRYGAD